MKRTLLFPLLAVLALGAGGCQKQQTEAERNAEIERQVQQRLKTERQTDDRRKRAQRQAELEARLNALAAAQSRPAATAAPAAVEPRSTVASTPEAESGSYSTFYRKLEPYGDWMETGEYGYVFQPRQAAQSRDWRPYTSGRWVYTDAGWTWISDEQFGWATYHYGRWIRFRDVGWVWVPGEQWAPAWVSWRKGNDYVGWAPLPPEAQFDRQVGIGNWADNYYGIGPEQYAFVAATEFGRKLNPHEIVPAERNLTIINQTTNVTNITYNNSEIVDRGPSYNDLRSQSHQPIERFRLERTRDLKTEGPVFRGDVVAVPTMKFPPAGRAERPNRVARTIAQPVTERGWTGIRDEQAAQKARAKMEAEAAPPASLPPRKFVGPKQEKVAPSRPVPIKRGQAVSPAVSAATAIPVGTPAPLPGNPPTAPPGTATPATISEPDSAPIISSRPHRAKPSQTPAASAAPTWPRPAETNVSSRKANEDRPDARRKEKQTQRLTEQQRRIEEHPGKDSSRPRGSPTATPQQPAATPLNSEAETSPAASSSPSVRDKKSAADLRRARRAELRTKTGQGQAAPSPAPNPTATFSPQPP